MPDVVPPSIREMLKGHEWPNSRQTGHIEHFHQGVKVNNISNFQLHEDGFDLTVHNRSNARNYVTTAWMILY